MPSEPYPSFFLSRDAGLAAPARPEPVLGWPPPRAGEERERWTHPLLIRAPLGRWGGVSTVLHLLALAATLLWASRFIPPAPIDAGDAVAMVFAPAERPALPPAVPTDQTAAPSPLAPPAPAIAEASQALPLAAPAPLAEPVQSLTPPPPAPPKPAERPRPAHPAPTRMAKANPSQTSAAARAPEAAPSPPADPPAGPQLATAALVPPHPLSAAAGNHAPLYPVSAMRRREQGRVVLDVDVTADGRADAVRIAISSGFPTLDRAAIEAVRLWRFHPATRGGTPVPAVAEVPFNFTLSD